MPMAFEFFLSMQQSGGNGGADVRMVNRVSEYLSFTMVLMMAFGLCFQLPVILTLLGASDWSRQMACVPNGAMHRRCFCVAALLTPPDLISQIGLGVPTLLLYEISIWCVAAMQKLAMKRLIEAVRLAFARAPLYTEHE